ncbi:MAG: LysM domain-containing protein, partial [Chitinophagaceae bacterium]
MTLQEIFNILEKNISDNGGTLKLSSTLIPSPGITKIFNEYLLNKDLEVLKAVPVLNAESVTVTGEGNSLIFFKTTIDALTFTVDDAQVPSMSVHAEAIIKDKDGWTFGESFPVLRYTNWGGFFDPADKDKKKWIQKLFYESAEFFLSEDGLSFTGMLLLKDNLEPLSVLFKGNDKVKLQGDITLNKGEDGYKVTVDTVMPETFLRADIGDVELPLDSFSFRLSFGLKASAHIIKKGKELGRPGASLEILIQSTIPVNNEELGIAIGVGTIADALTMRMVLPESTEIGMPELISLANNSNVLAVMPSNIPIIDAFVLKDWQLTFNTKEKTISQIAIAVATRESFEWALIPNVIAIKYLGFWLGVTYFNKKIEPSLTIDGTIGLGTDAAIRFDVSATFPGFVFTGALDPETPVDLRPILVDLLGKTIGESLPDTLQLGVLEISIDPKNTTYSLAAALTTDLQIPVVLTTIVVRAVIFNIDYVAGQATGSIEGQFNVGKSEDSPAFSVIAAYAGAEEGWTFTGALMDGSKIKLKEIIDQYLPEEYHQFNIFNITITALSASFTKKEKPTYEFLLTAEWLLDLGLADTFDIAATVKVAYDSSKVVGKQYEGYIEGSLEFGNIKMGARVDFKEGNKDYTFYLNAFQAKLTKNPEGDSIICFSVTDETSLGDVITLLVNAATGEDITLPSPWNVLNNIKLKNFGFSFNITKKKIGLSYKANINFGFIQIEEITLFYTYGGAKPIVEFAITQGKFLGGAKPLPEPWNVLDPSKAPEVPGKGPKVFQLDFLGMGQHVSLKTGLNPNSVSEAVGFLKAGFEKKTLLVAAADNSPIGQTGLRFNSNSNWLIGTEFVILETFRLGIVFFDPDVYGLAIYVDGAKAKVFQGLKFEILYKKVTDTVGVYQIYFKLPDTIRQIDFGSVSVTLPSIRLYIYTNGDFKVDLGFPVKDNFSESFGLQMLPFVGAGGFYIGVLSAATATTIPQTTKGNFSPVIVFGIGLRVGIGKEINKGIMKAGLSLTVQGILEGTFAQYNAFKGSGTEDEVYYYIIGKIAIVGHLYGEINFAIISAELDIRVYISARVVLEAHEPILLSFEAGVSVSLKVKINLGIFSFSISLSFSATIRESFTIGRPTDKPWDKSLSMPFRRPALRALDTNEECKMLPLMNWRPIAPEAKLGLPMLYVPQMSVATTKEDPNQKPRMTAMLYLETSVDVPLAKLRSANAVGLDEDYPFTKFAKGVFLWVLGAFINKTDQPIPVDTIMNTTIEAKNLTEILCYFNVKDQLQPFAAEKIIEFMEHYLDITITVPPRIITEDDKQVSIFPMLPMLSFKTPAGTIYFDDEKAKYLYDEQQLSLIRELFRELSVRAAGNRSQNAPGAGNSEKQSLATYMFVDYVALLAKEAVQRASDRMAELVIPAPEGKSLNDIVNENPHYGITAQEIAFSNRTRPLSSGVGLRLTGVQYTVKEGDTLDSISHRLNIQKQELLQMNSFTRAVNPNPCAPAVLWKEELQTHVLDENKLLIAGSRLTLPVILHTTSANRADNLLSVANQYAVSVHSLITENVDVPDLFPTGKNIRVPFVESIVIKDLIKAMDEKFDFEHMAGLSANMMLQGLRVPVPEADSKIGKPEALYVVTGQEIDAAALQTDEALSLELETALPWLNLGTAGGTSVPFTLVQEDIDTMQSLAATTLTPQIVSLHAIDLYEIQAKKYTLPSHIEWQSSQAITLVNGSNHFAQTIDPSIWAFKNNLRSLISGAN